MDKTKLIKMFVALTAIVVLVSSLSRLIRGNSMSLSEYASLNGSPAPSASVSPDARTSPETTQSPEPKSTETPMPSTPLPSDTPQPVSLLTGASLNGSSQLSQRYTLKEGFYYEPLSDNLRRFITGISYPVAEGDEADDLVVTFDDLCYVHIMHIDFEGNSTEGELICNAYIAQDLVEIFYELYRNEYQLERVLLIDEYDGDDIASMEDDNTSCFNYRVVEGSSSLSKHAYGLAIDVNPFYNPYITYNKDGSQKVSPAAAVNYADRSASFPYKIDEEDLCYKLFVQHGFTWGGNWNSSKDYQHFQKPIE